MRWVVVLGGLSGLVWSCLDRRRCALTCELVVSCPDPPTPHSLTHSLTESLSLAVACVCLSKDQRRKHWRAGGHVPPEFGMQNRNSLKIGQMFTYRNPKLLQLLGDFVPRPSTGASPLDPTGRLLSPDPMQRTSPHILHQVYTPAHTVNSAS